MKFSKNLWAIIAFNALYIIGFAVYYASIKNYEFLWYILVLVAIALLVLFTLKKTKLDNFALWGLSIWGLLHMMGGGLIINGQTLYKFRILEIIDKGGDFFILKMDQAIHFYGFAIAAIVVFQLLSIGFDVRRYPKTALLLAWLGSMGLGALNEIVEFIAFVIIANTGVGDLYNTGLDLIFNMLGALVGSLIAFYHYKKSVR